MKFTSEELLKSHLQSVTNEIEYRKEEILSKLDHVMDSVNRVKKDIKDNFFSVSGGQLQNVWQVYLLLGQLEKLQESQHSLQIILNSPNFTTVKGS